MRRNRESAARNKLIQEMHLDRRGQQVVDAISEATGKKYRELYNQRRGLVKQIIRTAKNTGRMWGSHFVYGPAFRDVILNIEKVTRENIPACRAKMENQDTGEVQMRPCGRVWP